MQNSRLKIYGLGKYIRKSTIKANKALLKIMVKIHNKNQIVLAKLVVPKMFFKKFTI